MKAFLVALTLLILPSIAWAAPQMVTITYDSPSQQWVITGAAPALVTPGALVGFGNLAMIGKKATATLLSLQATNGKEYTCKATLFFSFRDAFNTPFFATSSLSKCVAQN